MKKMTSLGVTAFAAVVALLAILGSQSPAQAYPDVRIDLTVNRTVLYGGQDFTATASSNVSCAWNLEWAGLVRQGNSSDGSDFNTVYTAGKVAKVTKIPLHGTCVYTSPSTNAETIWDRTVVITVRPQSTAVAAPVGSDLPNTGGPNRLFLFGGVALLLAGATAVTVARRRAEEAEIQAFRA
jgi:LPXTG-motif cell wall-anchored protein